MNSIDTRLHFIEGERVLLGRYLNRVAARRDAGPRQQAKAVAIPADAPAALFHAWVPISAIALLTLAMLSALIIPH